MVMISPFLENDQHYKIEKQMSPWYEIKVRGYLGTRPGDGKISKLCWIVSVCDHHHALTTHRVQIGAAEEWVVMLVYPFRRTVRRADAFPGLAAPPVLATHSLAQVCNGNTESEKGVSQSVTSPHATNCILALLQLTPRKLR